MAKRLFRVLGGSHDEGGKIYQKGEQVASDRDLVSMFGRNKFEAVGDFTPAVVKSDKTPIPQTKKAVPRQEKNKSTIDPGTGIDLSKEVDAADSKVDLLDVHAFGVDITEEFPKATEAGLRVYKKRGWCTVVDDGTKVNDKGIKQADVEAFIANMLEGEDDEDF